MLIGKKVVISYQNGEGMGRIAAGGLRGFPFSILNDNGKVITYLDVDEATSLADNGFHRDLRLAG